MTVTGHVPQALSTMAGIEAGMDQINHLNYVTSMLRTDANAPTDLQSDIAIRAIAFLLEHHTVVDPTSSWEMSGHSREVDVASFEPGITTCAFDTRCKVPRRHGRHDDGGADEGAHDTDVGRHRSAAQGRVPIVPGSDTGLVRHGFHREIELYVQAGMTPLAAIQSATIVSARAMGLDRDSGTIEPGKRADLIVVNGDPLKDITLLRRVTRLVTNGRMYDASALWHSVGFRTD